MRNFFKAAVAFLVSVFEKAHQHLFDFMAKQGMILCMGNATGRDLHIDVALSQMAIGYRPQNFIADMIFPVVQVQKQSDLYIIFDKGDRSRIEDTTRAPGTMARRVTENIGSGNYFAKNYALASAAVLEDQINADAGVIASLYNGKATFLLDKLMLDWEKRVANLVTSGSNVGSYSSPTSAWNGAGNPIGDINTALDNVRGVTGYIPNNIVMGVDAWMAFRRDSTVRNLIFGLNNGGGYPSVVQAANLLSVDRILVGGAYQNTGQENVADSLSAIWGDQVLAYYAPPTPALDRPSFAYAFRWAAPGLPNMQVERHPFDTKTKSEDIEVGYYQDEKVTASTYGFLLAHVNSSH